jgi:hypothetical protein
MSSGKSNRSHARKAGKIVIAISPAFDQWGKRRHEFFEARVEGDDRIICISRTPLLDSARQLISEGVDPKTHINMRHVGSAIESFEDPLPMGYAARFTVKGGKFVPRTPSPGPTAGATAAKNPPRAAEAARLHSRARTRLRYRVTRTRLRKRTFKSAVPPRPRLPR